MILYALIVFVVVVYLVALCFAEHSPDPSQDRESQNRESQFVADEHGAAGGWHEPIRPAAIGRVETVRSEREVYERAPADGRAAQAHWETGVELNPPRYERVSPTEIRRIPDEPKR